MGKAEGNYNVFTPSYWLGELDLRPLGFMRIVFGAVLFFSVADIGPVLFTFLSDEGVMPRHALLNGLVRGDRFSIFYSVGPNWLLATLFAGALLSLASFTAGYHTKLSNIAAYILVCGIHERDLMLFDGADNVIRVMLFWLLFMPSGARYSIDAVLARARGETVRETAPALPMRIGQLQIAWIYANTVMHKWPGTSWHDGSALHTALGLDHLFTRTLGKLVFQVPALTSFGTHFALIAERSFFPLVFLPIFQPRPVQQWLAKQTQGVRSTVTLFFQPTYKALAICYGTALHLGIATMMSVGNFSYIMISSYLLLFEPAWTVAVISGIGRMWRWVFGGKKLKVLYDGECGFCVRIVRLLQGLDPFETLELLDFRDADALERAGGLPSIPKEALERRMHVVAPGGAVKAGYRGIVSVALRLPALTLFGVLGSIPGMQLLGDPLYDAVAGRRQELHPKCDGTCAVPAVRSTPIRDLMVRLVPRPLKIGASGVLFLGLIYLAIGSAWFSLPSTMKALGRPIDPDSHMPQWWSTSVQSTELWQKWDMFSPNPSDTDIYLMGRGELSDGTQVDVLRGDGHGGPMPPIYPEMFFSRWTKFIHNLAYAGQPWLVEFGRYICRHWNNDGPPGRAQLKTFKIFREQRRVPEVGRMPVPWGEQMIWDHRCF
jgi:predicted DCC family thiol-disulfide oxidoreductase YuxK